MLVAILFNPVIPIYLKREPWFYFDLGIAAMNQRKGERTAAQNEREFPHIVELAVPPGGFRARLDAMYDFHRERGLEAHRGRGERRDNQDFVRWCFANRSDAEAFAKAFGGALIE